MAARGRGKQVVVAFRVDQHLAGELDRLPDKSGFIRAAIERAFHVACPVCEGRGTVSHETAGFVGRLLGREGATRCPCCGAVSPTARAAAGARRARPRATPRRPSPSAPTPAATAATTATGTSGRAPRARDRGIPPRGRGPRGGS
jgi:hypothetical protein